MSDCLEAADEIGLAVIPAIIAVFIPASFMRSVPGQFFKQFGNRFGPGAVFPSLRADDNAHARGLSPPAHQHE